MTDSLDILKQYWGHSSFRLGQQEIVETVLEGRDVLALLPTGGGKSICFQVPALAKDGLCLVISPLLALMKDQLENLRQRGISAVQVVSGMSSREIEITLDNCRFGSVKFLYVSPERLLSELFIERLKLMNVNLIAVDEAHCVSQWGYDFRPAYLQIAEVKAHFPKVPMIALTATATPAVQKDICKRLKFKNEAVFTQSFSRDNLAYVVGKEDDKYGRLLRLCTKVQGTGIVYVGSRRKTKQVADFLVSQGISAAPFHAGLERKLKNNLQERWKKNTLRVMVSTNAFGMGIDKPNVRFVAHMDIPLDPESYFQEAGRAGRDGKMSFAALFYNNEDLLELERRSADRYPELDEIRKVYQSLGSHFQIAYGSGVGTTFPIDIGEFVRKFDLSVIPTYNALKLLENGGYVALNESLEQGAQLKMRLNKEALYEFQVRHPRLDPLIRLLLRSYEGLFDRYAKIDIQLLAKRAKLHDSEILKLLQDAHKREVLEFYPPKKGGHITWLRERVPKENIQLDKSIYRDRKKLSVVRANFMNSYVESDQCRSLMLLQYFGEKLEDTCGICDWCLEQKRLEKNTSYKEELAHSIREQLSQSPCTVTELSDLLHVSKEQILHAVHWKLDCDDWQMVDGEKVALKKVD